MSKYLISTVETYRVDSENEAEQLIANNKKSNLFTLTRYSNVKKEQKSKGEIVDEWNRVTLTKTFTEEREPSDSIDVYYQSAEC